MDAALHPETKKAGQSTSGPLVVLLQGPVGPFFHHLAGALRKRGWRVLKINFSIGDVLYARGPGTLLFRDGPEQWKAWFRTFLNGNKPSAVVLFGDQRLYHRHAVDACKDYGIDVWCMEEGYIRPNYITFELGGNNGASSSVAASEFALSSQMPATSVQTIQGNSFGPMARAATAYFIAKNVCSFFVPDYVHHRHRSLATEAFFWNRNAWRKWSRRMTNASSVLELLEHHDRKYFCVALQVHDDLNLIRHGNGWSMEILIEAAIRSFSQNARDDELLVIKCHPLDRGHWTYDHLVAEISALANVSGRVRLIDDGPLGLLLRHARGLVVVNSTAGILALRIGCPLFVLGEAVFKHETLVQSGGVDELNQFWHNPVAVAAATRDSFLSLLIARTQVNGDLYQRNYVAMTVAAMIEKMDARLQASLLMQAAVE